MAKALKNQRSHHGHHNHPSTSASSSAASSTPSLFVGGGGHEGNEVKLCRLVDTAFERIQELQGLCQQEKKLTGVNKQAETMDPILCKQAELMSRIEAMQKFKQNQRNKTSSSRAMQFSTPRGASSLSPRNNSNADATNSHNMNMISQPRVESPVFVRNSTSGSKDSRVNHHLGGSMTVVDNSVFARNPAGISIMTPAKSSPMSAKIEGRNGSPIMYPDSSIFPRNNNQGYGPADNRNDGYLLESAKRLEQGPFVQQQQHSDLGLFDRLKSSNGTELQPDQKYNKLTSSSFQFGLPPIGEVPMSKLKPVQAVLTPSLPRTDRKSRRYLHDPNNTPFMVLIPESQEIEKEIRDASADSMNDSAWSFHTANDHDSLLDFDITADDIGSDEGTSALCPSMENLNLRRPVEVDMDGNSNLQLESTKPFEMSDFYKYSAKWRQYLNSSSPHVSASQQRPVRRRSALITELQRGRFDNDFGDGAVQQNQRLPNSEPPLPPRTKLPRNVKQSTETSSNNNNDAWVMDTPTIV